MYVACRSTCGGICVACVNTCGGICVCVACRSTCGGMYVACRSTCGGAVCQLSYFSGIHLLSPFALQLRHRRAESSHATRRDIPSKAVGGGGGGGGGYAGSLCTHCVEWSKVPGAISPLWHLCEMHACSNYYWCFAMHII